MDQISELFFRWVATTILGVSKLMADNIQLLLRITWLLIQIKPLTISILYMLPYFESYFSFYAYL